jgi:hypothetical protein
MNKIILSSVFSVFFLLLEPCGLSQDHDLIVTTKGDSIACRIDSITDKHIYFEMKSQNIWAQTHIILADVSEYKHNAIDKKQIVFKPGTSIIDYSKPAIPASLYHVRKNSVYIGILSINYARMIPLGQTSGLTLGGGLINIDGWGVVAESSVLFGSVKHFFEPGIMGAYFFEISDESGEVVQAVTLRIGYRYQAPMGLLIRLAPNLIFSTEDTFVFPALSIGYSF